MLLGRRVLLPRDPGRFAGAIGTVFFGKLFRPGRGRSPRSASFGADHVGTVAANLNYGLELPDYGSPSPGDPKYRWELGAHRCRFVSCWILPGCNGIPINGLSLSSQGARFSGIARTSLRLLLAGGFPRTCFREVITGGTTSSPDNRGSPYRHDSARDHDQPAHRNRRS